MTSLKKEKVEGEDDSHCEDENGEDLNEDTFAEYVEVAKKELKKQVISMFIFSTVFTFGLYALFYFLIENQNFSDV